MREELEQRIYQLENALQTIQKDKAKKTKSKIEGIKKKIKKAPITKKWLKISGKIKTWYLVGGYGGSNNEQS